MRKKLEFQADRIEHVLHRHHIAARVTGGTVTPRWVRFNIIPRIGEKVSRIKSLAEEIAQAMDATDCRISRRGAAVLVEVPRDDPKPVRLIPLFSQISESDQPWPPATSLLGLADDGAPLLIRLPSPDVAHILVAGTTGSGKTTLLQGMIITLAATNAPATSNSTSGLGIVLIDPKGGAAFGIFGGLPHLARPLITDMDDVIEALASLVRLMERRSSDSAMKRPTIVVFIDEMADLLLVGGKQIQTALTRLTQRGRESDIHIVAATQKPTSAVLGPLVKANFPVRLVGKVTSADDARTATGWSGTGAERLMGKGDFIAVAEGRVTRFQAPHVNQTEIERIVKTIAQKPGQDRNAPPTPPVRVRRFNGVKGLDFLAQLFRPAPAPAPAPVMVMVEAVQEASVPHPAPAIFPASAPTIHVEDIDGAVLPVAEEKTEAESEIRFLAELRQGEWERDGRESFRAACRHLKVSSGGDTFHQVKQAVIALRAERETGCGKDVAAVVYQKDEVAAAAASPEEPPPPHPAGEEGAVDDGSNAAIALESQPDSSEKPLGWKDNLVVHPIYPDVQADAKWWEEELERRTSDSRVRQTTLALPAEITWTLPVLGRAMKTLDRMTDERIVNLRHTEKIIKLLEGSIQDDRNDAGVHLVFTEKDDDKQR